MVLCQEKVQVKRGLFAKAMVFYSDVFRNHIFQIMQDVKDVYRKEFDAALHEYNTKQTRPERRIDDYFEHVSKTEQDMAVEIIIQCGDPF